MARKFFTGIDAQDNRVLNVGSPVAGTDAANRQYVDALVNGQAWKSAVDAATTADAPLATAYVAGQTVDGYMLGVGDRLLIKNQTSGNGATDNGIYLVQHSGAPVRAPDAVQGELVSQTTVMVEHGTVNGGTSWTMNAPDPVTVGTTALTWARSGGALYTAGNGLALGGGAFSVVAGPGIIADGTSTRIDPSVVVSKFAQTIGDGTSTSITVTHGLNTKDVSTVLYVVATGEVVDTDILDVTSTSVTLSFATAPAAGALRAVVHG